MDCGEVVFVPFANCLETLKVVVTLFLSSANSKASFDSTACLYINRRHAVLLLVLPNIYLAALLPGTTLSDTAFYKT